MVTVIHQNHDYSHIPESDSQSTEQSEAQWEGPEAKMNRKLSAESMGTVHQFTMLDATHVLTSKFLLPALELRYLKKRWHSVPVLHPRAIHLYQVLSQLLIPLKRLNERRF